MIPTVVARQTRETVLDYLRTTFALADDLVVDAPLDSLDSETRRFRASLIDGHPSSPTVPHRN